jgi:4'-phosphopantetheinyl transferase
MLTIYQADAKRIQGEKSLEKLLEKLPVDMHKRALRYKFKKDAYNFVVGRLLLKRGLEALGKVDQFERIAYQTSGKPFLDDVFFNISHSGDLVVCVLSTKGVVGIDIEKIKEVKLEDFDAWFSKKEWTEINNASSPLQKFYWYWTRKESIIKALGVTLSYLHKIEVDATKDHFIENGKKWYLKDLDFGAGYFGALCSEVEIAGFDQKTIS